MKKLTKVFAYISFVFAFCFMAIGYAAVQDTLLVEGSISVKANDKIYAVAEKLSEGQYKLTFLKGQRPQENADTTVYDVSTEGYTSENPPPWSNVQNLYEAAVQGEFKAPQSLAYWFYGCSQFESIDLSGLDTSEVTDFQYMFSGCSGLTKILVDTGFVCKENAVTANMFGENTILRGGAGTVFDSTKTGREYARIDGGTVAPGLFTYKYYALVFDGNHDDASNVPSMMLSESSTFELPKSPVHHPWAIFSGWATTANATVPEYTGDTFTTSSATPYCDVLYAVWSGLGATTPEDLEEDAQEPDAGTANNPLIIGGGDWTIFGSWSADPSIINGKNLVIYDGSFVGDDGVFLWTQNAVITIEGGHFEAQYLAVFPTNLTLNIKSGVFKISDELFMTDGFSDADAIIISGGKFTKDPRNYTGAVIDDECTVQDNGDGTWSVVKAE